jgi:hypothetical protein
MPNLPSPIGQSNVASRQSGIRFGMKPPHALGAHRREYGSHLPRTGAPSPSRLDSRSILDALEEIESCFSELEKRLDALIQ